MVRWAFEHDVWPSSLVEKAVWDSLNKKQVLVFEDDGQVKGMVVLFDAGHRFLYVDHLSAHSKRAAIMLMKRTMEYADSQGIHTVYFTSASRGLKDLARAQSADILENVTYTAFVPVKPTITPRT